MILMNNLQNQIIDYNKRMKEAMFGNDNTLKNQAEITISKLINKIKIKNFRFTKQALERTTEEIKFNVSDITPLGGLAHLIVHYDIPLLISLHNETSQESIKKDIIEILLNNKLNPNLKDEYGFTFIESAITGKYSSRHNDFEANRTKFIIDLINLAKKYGLDVNTTNYMGNTIIHTAISSPYYNGKIIDLIKALGDKFNIRACNKQGNDIISHLDSCIFWKEQDITKKQYDNENIPEEEIEYLERLKAQRDEIVDYVNTMSNPLAINPDTRQLFLQKINELDKLINSNLIKEAFLGSPDRTCTYINKSIIDFKNIELLMLNEKELQRTHDSLIELNAKEKFGILSDEIIYFLNTGIEPSCISFHKLGIKSNNPYPTGATLIEKAKWLHITMHNLSQQDNKIMGGSRTRIHTPRQGQ